MAELLENESEVSDVDPEELANLIKGVDAMDDELFGFSSKKKQESKELKEELKTKEDKEFKSKSVLKELPVNDPLADISLSDDDFYNITGAESKSPAISSKISVTKPESKTPEPKTSPLKMSRTKKIADLFGLNENPDSPKEEKKTEAAFDWLGIKESPEKNKQDSFNQLNEIGGNNTEILPTLESKQLKTELDISMKKSVLFDVGQDLEEPFHVRRRKSSAERVGKFQDLGGKENQDDVFGLLEDKNMLKTGVGDESKTSASGRILETRGRRGSDEKKSKAESDFSWGKPVEQANVDHYTPSAGTSRRLAHSRRQDISLLSNQNTASTSLKAMDIDWLTTTSQEKSKHHVETIGTPEDVQYSSSGKDNTEKLPQWLGGGSTQLDKEQNISKNMPKVTKSKQSEEKPAEVITAEALLTTSSMQNEQTALALQRTEAQIMTALQLKQQRQNMDIVCQKQTQLLEIQERQLNSLVERQLSKQSEVEAKLQAQQERIGLLLQTLMTTDSQNATVSLPVFPQPVEVPKHTSNSPVSESYNKTLIDEIEAELKKLKTENEYLVIRNELLEKTHQNDLTALNQAHQKDLEMWLKQEERIKACNKQIEDDYEARIHRLQNSIVEQLQLEKDWAERMQTERLSDLNKLAEFYRVQFEQMSDMYKWFPRDIRPTDLNTLVKISGPSDETHLSAREVALIQKEVELAAMQEKLTSQKENLDTRTEELDEKMEQERIKNEEMSRQLRREKREMNTKEQLWLREQEHMKQQHVGQMQYIEELRENVVKEQTMLAEEKLKLAEERARLEALLKLQGIVPGASFDILQARAEVHGAFEAAKSVEVELGCERQRLREVQRSLELERWKLQEYDRDLAIRAEHLDQVLQASELNKEEGLKALDQAKKVQQTAEQKFAEVEQRMNEVSEREHKLIKDRMQFSQEEIRLNKRREHLDQILPELSAEESLSLQPVSKGVIDPKLLIMKLKAERELEGFGR